MLLINRDPVWQEAELRAIFLLSESGGWRGMTPERIEVKFVNNNASRLRRGVKADPLLISADKCAPKWIWRRAGCAKYLTWMTTRGLEAQENSFPDFKLSQNCTLCSAPLSTPLSKGSGDCHQTRLDKSPSVTWLESWRILCSSSIHIQTYPHTSTHIRKRKSHSSPRI
jgi:hypothetical protein